MFIELGLVSRRQTTISQAISTLASDCTNHVVGHQQKSRPFVCDCRHYIPATIMIITLHIHLVLCRVS